jgi:hypothetical protein
VLANKVYNSMGDSTLPINHGRPLRPGAAPEAYAW